MAVYKPTYCEPFLTNFDARVTSAEETQYFRCHIESSNKDITGYSIRVLDSSNNQIFPAKNIGTKISPIEELVRPENNLTLENTGLNGTYLSIPFIQNLYNTKSVSYNAIYYQANYKVKYVMFTDITPEHGPESAEYIGVDPDPNLSTKWRPVANTDPEQITFGNWNGVLNGEVVAVGDLILSLSSEQQYSGIWKVLRSGNLERYIEIA